MTHGRSRIRPRWIDGFLSPLVFANGIKFLGFRLPTAGRDGHALIAARQILAFEFVFEVPFRAGLRGRSVFVEVKLLVVVKFSSVRHFALRRR